MANNTKEEPKSAPQSDRWYNLTLGPSFKNDSSNKFCTLRYEFKPASIDKTKAGSLHKTKENRVSVEFHNNQLGKPKVTFEGSSEEYKENDAVLFFDGESFRLERLHRAVKQLRHLRKPGESAAAAAAAASSAPPAAAAAVEPRLSPVAKGGAKPSQPQAHLSKPAFQAVPVEVERIDIGAKPTGKRTVDYPSDAPNISSMFSPDPKNDEAEDHQDIDIEDLFGSATPEDETAEEKENTGFDINMSRHNDSDDEIADVDDSGDEADKGPNAAEALRAQVNAEVREEPTSSSSTSSGSGSSGSGSGSGSSSSSDTEASDDDSVNSI